VWCLLAETQVNAEIDRAYTQLKALLAKSGCTVTAENQPQSLTAKQGSLWGISPKTAKKTITFELAQGETGTRIASASALSADYWKLTIAGCIFASALALLCIWISLDLAAFAASQEPSVWSWLATPTSGANLQAAVMLSDLTRVLAVFLAVTLALELFIVAFVRSKIDTFAEQAMRSLAQDHGLSA